MSVRSTVLRQMAEVASQHDRQTPPLTDDLPILDSGLDSLCIAILVATLEDELGVDPFESARVEYPVTVGDLVRLYELAAV